MAVDPHLLQKMVEILRPHEVQKMPVVACGVPKAVVVPRPYGEQKAVGIPHALVVPRDGVDPHPCGVPLGGRPPYEMALMVAVVALPVGGSCASHVLREKVVVAEPHPCGVQMVERFLASFGGDWTAFVHHGCVVVNWASSVVVACAFVPGCTVEHQLVACCAVERHPYGVPLNAGHYQ